MKTTVTAKVKNRISISAKVDGFYLYTGAKHIRKISAKQIIEHNVKTLI